MSEFSLGLDEAVDVARTLVVQRFPTVMGAWLAGSVATGLATANSDLDIVVLIDGDPAPFRESLAVEHEHRRIPVELFVYHPESLTRFVDQDHARRQPSLARMVVDGISLLDATTAASDALRSCRSELAEGPDSLSQNEIDAARYAVTDLLEDLLSARTDRERAVVAATLWEAAARLLLGVDRCWQGTGKGLLRALLDRDSIVGDGRGQQLADGLAHVGLSDETLAAAVRAVLDRAGGALFEGYRVGGWTPPQDSCP